jgi:hypothetical protein
MRLITSFLILTVALCSCGREQDKVSTDLINIKKSESNTLDEELPLITFDNVTVDFGKVVEGEIVSHTFKFENTGDAPLIISRVEPSCGCTTAKNWSSKPYAPGAEGEISIDFDSNQRPGSQKKSIQVIANTNPAVTNLYLRGDVIGPDSN